MSMDQKHAQQRIDRIAAFRDELDALEAGGAATIPPPLRTQIDEYHQNLLAELRERFDVDVSAKQRQLSLGMRITSFLGALALAAALLLFFLRFWGGLPTWMQVAILITLPMLLVAGVEFVARRERTLYFASLTAFVAFAAFVLDLRVLGAIFNITPSPNAFLVWGTFALLLAYGYGLRLMLVAGLTCVMGWLAAEVGTWSGAYWLSFGERPEHFLLAGGLIALAGVVRHPWQTHFAGIYRNYGLIVWFLAVLILANWGRISYLSWSANAIEQLYQAVGFLTAALATWVGIRRGWPGVINVGTTFFVLFLYTKLFDWWWEWLPKYLFFLLIGLISVGLLLALKWFRNGHQEVAV